MSHKTLEVYAEPVTLEEARAQCYLTAEDSDGHPQDSSLLIYIAAARDWAERFTGLAFARKRVELSIDMFPTDIELEAPATDVISVEYYDSAAELQTLAPQAYILDSSSEKSWISPATGYDFPTTQIRPNAVKVTYDTGFGVSEEIPPAAKQAILLLVGHFFENRENSVDKAVSNIPNGAESLLRPLRVNIGMA